ncbi:hypothetical protein [uncultured Methanobrevibacter sp.]|uniref:hypothetical protein n=1 Tax=uncultured Methanobrevibacter sp. TaxID=253161 RepID=UPI0025F227F0|nr:hypothetical protein [uncultured Methanobrevibacter sp.]
MIKTFEQYLVEGAWGYGSLDNDYVLDDRDELLKDFINAILNKCEENNKGDGNSAWKTIGLIDSLTTMLRSIGQMRIFLNKTKTLELYQEAIDVCNSDEKFINDWREPNAMRVALEYANDKLKAYKSIMYSELGVPVENNRLLDE